MADPEYPDEEWRTIAKAPDYEVSSLGRIRRAVPDKCGRRLKVLKASCPSADPYPRINLWVEGKHLSLRVHPLVCEAFHGPPPAQRSHAAHWDGDCENNRADNLRWATAKENRADTARHGRIPSGDKHGSRTKPWKFRGMGIKTAHLPDPA